MSKHEDTERFGGPGSSHQDRAHPGKNGQTTGHKGGGAQAGTAPSPGSATNGRGSRVSGGGGEHDRHHAHDRAKS